MSASPPGGRSAVVSPGKECPGMGECLHRRTECPELCGRECRGYVINRRSLESRVVSDVTHKVSSGGLSNIGNHLGRGRVVLEYS